MKQKHKVPLSQSKLRSLPIITLIVSAILWLVAAILPVYSGTGPNGHETIYMGMTCFTLGLFSLALHPVFFVVWSSNIVSWVALWLLFSKKYKDSLVLAIVAAVCSLGSLLITSIPYHGDGSQSLSVTMGIGGYLWIASVFTILCGAIISFVKFSKLKEVSMSAAPGTALDLQPDIQDSSADTRPRE
jgi:hypothetical protein